MPPRWFLRRAWSAHHVLDRVSGGRLVLRRPSHGRPGTLRLITVGRRSGQPRSVLVGYLEDGTDLVAIAANGWGAGDPAWWLNLQARPEATVDLADGARAVVARAARGDERKRLWHRWSTVLPGLDAHAAQRPGPTTVVVLEPAGRSADKSNNPA